LVKRPAVTILGDRTSLEERLKTTGRRSRTQTGVYAWARGAHSGEKTQGRLTAIKGKRVDLRRGRAKGTGGEIPVEAWGVINQVGKKSKKKIVKNPRIAKEIARGGELKRSDQNRISTKERG